MAIRILHTSDWHLGKQLLKVDFQEDMQLFFAWLKNVVEHEQIDVLLMSGDLFDQANPSQQALQDYYRFLTSFLALDCKLIITGGNHDSMHVLNAPKDILEALDITVIGGAPNDLAELFIPIEKNGEKIVVAAVPYLRERDLRLANEGESYVDKVELWKKGLAVYFQQINNFHQLNFPDHQLILMGHLFTFGVETSESEREIQIGNQACVDASIFGQSAVYVALGHIHKPQRLGVDWIRYSGSPIPLSFSERADQKQVVKVSITRSEVHVTPILCPNFRKLVTFKGSVLEVREKLEKYVSDSQLIDLVELQVEEEIENIQAIHQLEEWLSIDVHPKLKVVKGKIHFKQQVQKTSQLIDASKTVSDFEPFELFEKRLDQDESLTTKEELKLAFKSLLEDLQLNQ